MGQTVIQKIMARAADRPGVRCGEIVNATIDIAFMHETTGHLAIKALREIGCRRVWDPAKVVVVLDHLVPAPSVKAAGFQKLLREFVREQQIPNFYDINSGVGHQVLAEQGYIRPGTVVVGADSHTCTGGALGAFATGIGSTELAAVLATGKLWFRVPETIKIEINGTLPPWATAKDVFLKIAGTLGVEGADYKAVEFTGDAIRAMDVDGRMTLCNMVIEMGGKCGLIEPDEKTWAFLGYKGEELKPDPGAAYAGHYEFNVDNLEPMVACPHSVDNVKPVGAVAGRKIDQVFLGSCTNGRYSDLEGAARILRGRKISESVRLIVTPASMDIYRRALDSGVIETLIAAGATVCNPNCGPCCGGHQGILAEGEVCLSTSNRNFLGRMGKGGYLYLASPLVAAASALCGCITDPREIGGMQS